MRDLENTSDKHLEQISARAQHRLRGSVDTTGAGKWAGALIGGLGFVGATAALSYMAKKLNWRLFNIGSEAIAVGGAVSAVGLYNTLKATDKQSRTALEAIGAEAELKERAMQSSECEHDRKKHSSGQKIKDRHSVNASEYQGTLHADQAKSQEAGGLTL